MWAYIRQVFEDGKTRCGTGTNSISKRYTCKRNLKRYALKCKRPGTYKLEYYYDGDSGYDEPRSVETVVVKEQDS